MYEYEMASVYDLVYRGRGKDFRGEVEQIMDVVRARTTGVASLLDVACGTGEHLRYLRESVPHVEGLELSEPMLRVAGEKLPSVPLHHADMRTFELAGTFDVVTCLFSSVGYMETVDELVSALGRMTAHLAPGGVLLVDPWWFPERFLDGYVAGDVVRDESRTVARVARSTREGGATRVEAHYLLADDGGVRHFTDTQLITLFDRDDYLGAFRRAGCDAVHLEERLSPRGLFVGTRPGVGRT
ncbi:class I SAM-dependent methyltransferase [Actinopolyspora mortivallis]|uniref:SAM-dependent methyltransferase n=1 Tax=Actinopolyspora mortivallis TaxID=33906 RepID=A0A2T0GYR4_ACTMO|nr:class I SAM-dependent methyltransferase [Actinopolyspora mortivallis]PRW64249.1 SAM-dependent methyltransferase [Actinopolyspora mortivallis]